MLTPSLKVKGKFLTRIREDGESLVVTGRRSLYVHPQTRAETPVDRGGGHLHERP